MNRITIAILSLALASTSFAQHPTMNFGKSLAKKPIDTRSVKSDLRAQAIKHAKKKAAFKQLDSTTYYVWESQVGQWITEARSKITYNNDGLPILNEYYEDWGSGNFNLTDAVETNFDKDGNLLSSLYKEWDEFNKQWNLEYRDSSTYDNSGNVLEYLYQVYDNGKFENRYRSLSTYNTKGAITKLKSEQWDQGSQAWMPSTVSVLFYNGDDLMTTMVDSTWNKASNQWVLTTKDTFEYDANDVVTRQTQYSWNSNAWQLSERSIFKANKDGQITEKIEAEYDGTTWDSTGLSKYGYDANGNPNVEEYAAWEDDRWESNTRYEYTYDPVEKVNPIILNMDVYIPDYDQYIINLPLEEFDYLADGAGGWDKDYHEVYHYSDGGNASSVKILNPEVTLYPNPANGAVHIQLGSDDRAETYVIRSVNGALVEDGRLSNQDTIDVSNIPAGIYVVEVSTGAHVYRSKLLVE